MTKVKSTSIENCTSCNFGCLKKFTTPEQNELIMMNSSALKFMSGEVLVKQGSFISQVTFLKTGKVKVVLESSTGKNTILKLINKNNFLALPALGNQNTYPFTITAVTDVEVCQIRHDIFLDLCRENAEILNFLLRWYTTDYHFLYDRITVLNTRNNHGKLCSALLTLIERENTEYVDLSRKELAEYACISLESANKILSELKHDKILEVKDKRICILKRGLIERLSTIG